MRSSRSGTDPLDPGPRGFRPSRAAFRLRLSRKQPDRLRRRARAWRRHRMRFAAHRRRSDPRLPRRRRLADVRQPAAYRPFDLAELSRLRVGEGPIPTPREPAGAGRGTRSAAARGQGRRRYLAMGAGAVDKRSQGYAGRYGVMSFDPRLPRLLEDQPAARPSRPRRSRRLAAAQTPGGAVAGRRRTSSPWTRRRSVRRGSRASAGECRSIAGRSARPSSARKPRFRPTRLMWEADGRP